MKSPAPLPQEGGSYIRNADGSLRASDASSLAFPAPTPPAAPAAEPSSEPAPPPRRASKQPAKDA